MLVMTRVAAPGAGAEARPTLASQDAASAAASAAEGTLIRSAELDRYLAAHRQYSGTSALAAPGGLVRNAAATVPGR
jgi:sigma-E factor negative regulatory protein RseA